MQIESKLPANQQRHRQREQAPGVVSPHEEEGSEHHSVIPVINSADATAFVLHKPGLEGTEKQNTDNVADGVYAAQQKHDAVIQKSCHVQRAENTVEDDPPQRDQYGGVVIGNYDFRISGFDIIPRELLLAAGTFIF